MKSLWILGIVCALGCATTQPGTHVEVLSEGGAPSYVGGAAAPGLNKSEACGGAVARAVSAIADRFAQDNEELGDEIAKGSGATSGTALLHGYAKDAAGGAAVSDVQFDPIDHLCMATVRWKPALFVKDEVIAFAQRAKGS